MRLLATAFQLLAERSDLQQLLRDQRDRIPNFVEESLRYESPIKGDFRLSRVADDRGRRRHPGRHHPDGAHRRGQPRPAPLRASRTSSRSTVRTRASTSRSGTARTPAPARPSRAPRRASASSASSTARPASRSTRRCTDRPTHAATSTRPRTSSAASCDSTWSSHRSAEDSPRRYRLRSMWASSDAAGYALVTPELMYPASEIIVIPVIAAAASLQRNTRGYACSSGVEASIPASPR